MRNKTELPAEPSLFTRIYRYFYYTDVVISSFEHINFANIDSRIEPGVCAESMPATTALRIPIDFAEEIILKLGNNKDIISVSKPSSYSEIVWIRLIAPLVSTGLGTILGIVLGTLIFPGIGTLGGALIGSLFGAGLGLFGVGLDLIDQKSINLTFIGATFSSVTGGMMAGAGFGAFIGSFVPVVGTAIGALIGGISGSLLGTLACIIRMIPNDDNPDNDFGGGGDFSISESSEEDESFNNSASHLSALGKPLIEKPKIIIEPAPFVSIYKEIDPSNGQEEIASQTFTNII